jgi:AcrR family transcriptional regulator
MSPKTAPKRTKSELTTAAIVGAALDLAAEQGLEAITLQAVADRVGLSKSGVFSRVGSREALQSAVLDEYDRRFLAEVFVPAMQVPKGLPRLNALMRRWIERARVVESNTGCIYVAGAFEFDDRAGPLRDQLARGVVGWRTMLRRSVVLAIDSGEIMSDTDADQLVVELYSLMLGMYHEARFMRDARAADRAHAAYARLIASYQCAPSQKRPKST